MTSPTLFALAALALTLHSAGAPPPAAEDDAGEEGFIMNAWSNPETCHQHVAQSVTMASVIRDPENLLGECVMIEGIWHGRAIFDKAKYAHMRYSQSSTKLSRHRIGLYADWDEVGDLPEAPRRTRFVGILGNCETQWTDAVMVLGYCHYTGGPILLVSQRITE